MGPQEGVGSEVSILTLHWTPLVTPRESQADHDCLRLNFSTCEVGIRPALPPLCETDVVTSGLVTQALLWGPMKADLAPFGPHTQGQSGWLRAGPRFALESSPPCHLPVSATCPSQAQVYAKGCPLRGRGVCKTVGGGLPAGMSEWGVSFV